MAISSLLGIKATLRTPSAGVLTLCPAFVHRIASRYAMDDTCERFHREAAYVQVLFDLLRRGELDHADGPSARW